MYPFLSNVLSINVLANTHSFSTTETLSSVDISNAVGPVMVSTIIASGGSGTLTIQPVMATSASGTYINVPADAILDADTGLPTTFTVVSGTAANVQTVALKRDELYEFVGLLLTNSGSTGRTVTALVQFSRTSTSTAV